MTSTTVSSPATTSALNSTSNCSKTSVNDTTKNQNNSNPKKPTTSSTTKKIEIGFFKTNGIKCIGNSSINVANNASSSNSPSAKPTYSSLRTGIISLTPESVKCKLYCKGATCKYCNANGWHVEQQALTGIYSSWITDEILAMARPTSVSFEKYKILQQFKENNICTVINLQCNGEHSFCGPSLCSSGFTYEPEFLMQNKLYYYNFAIPDFETGTVNMILDVLKVIWFSLNNGKIAIHCHAGLGRTGTLIACYLVCSKNMTAVEAIDLVREARPNSVQSFKQIDAVVQVERAFRSLAAALPYSRVIGGDFDDNCVLPLSTILHNQARALPNNEARKFSHIPKLLFIVCDRLLRLIFEEDGVRYDLPSGTTVDKTNSLRKAHRHNVRTCTFGSLSVEWKNAFTHKGRAQVRYIMNLFARLAALLYNKDNQLKAEYRRRSLIGIEKIIEKMDASQLVPIINACMESIQRPYCDNKTLIHAMEWFAPKDIFDTAPSPPLLSKSIISTTNIEKVNDNETPNNGNELSTNKLSKNGIINALQMEYKKKPVDINADWHCMVFHLLNVLSYVSGENYDVLKELITYWLTGSINADVKGAVYSHMRELFVRNMHQQEIQATQLRQFLIEKRNSGKRKTEQNGKPSA